MLPVYLSYRPQDASSAARIIRRCDQVYGEYSVQHNPLRSCPTGTRIEQHAENLIASCRMVVILIGRKWAGLDEYGRYRLSTADVPVRAEVLAALRSKLEVVLVLLDGAQMPPAEVIPDELQSIFELPVVRLRSASFDADLDQLFPRPTLRDRLRAHINRWIRS